MSRSLHLTECPRDAMQGIHSFIPTYEKVEYIKALLDVGFLTLDAGSFVSPSAIPQMADTPQVFGALMGMQKGTEILAIIANERGANDAVQHSLVNTLGYPFSVSETFQQRNTRASIAESRIRLAGIQRIAQDAEKKLVVYLSMAFGNPYGDEWSPTIVADHAEALAEMGIRSLSLADTTGSSNPDSVYKLFSEMSRLLGPDLELGLHLHAKPEDVAIKTEAAWEAGCRRMDTAMKGFGGCPMASDSLTGNMDTEKVVEWCALNNIETNLNQAAFLKASALAAKLFTQYQ